ncbi:aromatic acid exporter family protein [Oerskovia flava]|uniref:aromatic acid exporter family protein n=1 Tax=Oerskovia flava TaxID=2986422 RepID=UPI00223FBEE9|nr:aromatic acid exporter family protein [Oerskovia sp. JB1-3-2]
MGGDEPAPREAAVGRWTRATVRFLSMRPRWAMAGRAAVAAALAWTVGLVAPEPFSDYPYYAPLGAVVATSTTVAGSVRHSVQAVGAIVLGAVIARGVDLVLAPSAGSVAVVVALAVLVGGWRVFGMMGQWAATSALFVLIIGNEDKVGFVTAYAGLVVVGAGIGILVNLAVPSLLLVPSERELTRLRDTLAEQLEEVAEGLEKESPPTAEEWAERRRAVQPVLEQTRASIARSQEATRGNVRARVHRRIERTAQQLGWAQALDVGASVVSEVTRLVAEWERQDRSDVALGPRLRPTTAEAVAAYARALRADDGSPDGPSTEEVTDAVDEVRREVRVVRGGSDEDYFAAGALVLALRRGVAALARDTGVSGP